MTGPHYRVGLAALQGGGWLGGLNYSPDGSWRNDTNWLWERIYDLPAGTHPDDAAAEWLEYCARALRRRRHER